MCQLDALKRLKCERDIVLKALKNLPETLDETYDRIFTLIPKEERLFVHHLLRWIAHHNELWNEDAMPCEILIQAATASTVVLTGEKNEYFYDQDTLREICGCLIEISPMVFLPVTTGPQYTYNSVKFAHYTVFEYLESGRSSRSASADHGAVEEISKEYLLEITLSEAQSVKSEELLSTEPWPDCYQIVEAVVSSFTNYCMMSGILSLYEWPDNICRHSVLSRLAVGFLDPSKPHFEITVMIASELGYKQALFAGCDLKGIWDWSIEWNPEVTTDAKHIYFLLLLGEASERNTTLIKNFLQEKDHKSLLQSRLRFRKSTLFEVSYRQDGDTSILFDGSILEVLTQEHFKYEHIIPFLMEICAGLFDPSVVLMQLNTGFRPEIDDHRNFVIQRLLELGADPNLTDYIVMPLQIATYRLNFEEARILLENGARPNSTGCSDGVAWEKDTTMSYLNHLHGASPLRILRKYTYISSETKKCYNPEEILRLRKKIEELLLQYGAEEISATPQAAADEVPYDTPEWREWAMASPRTQASTISKTDDHRPDPSADAPTITEYLLSRPDNSSDNEALPAFLTKILN